MMGDRSLSRMRIDTAYMDMPMLEEDWLVCRLERDASMGWKVHELAEVCELFPRAKR